MTDLTTALGQAHEARKAAQDLAAVCRWQWDNWQATAPGTCPVCRSAAYWREGFGLLCQAGCEPEAIYRDLAKYELAAESWANQEKTEAEISPLRRGMLTPFSEIRAEKVRWLWHDRIALGKMTALAGRPKCGKGLLYVRLIAELTTGKLQGDLHGPHSAIIVTSEDAPGDTLKPRLMAAGAALNRVHAFAMTGGDGAPFRVPQDAAELRERIQEVDAALVVVDPLMEYLDGRLDSHKSAQVRQAVASLTAVADECGCAILVVLHLNKGTSTDALMRHEGSVAFTQIIRGALLLGPDPTDPNGEHGSRRVLAATSSNLSKLAQSLSYEIRGDSVQEGEGNSQLIETAAIHYVGTSDASGRDVLSEQSSDASSDRSALDDAVEFLLAELADGPVASETLKAAARQLLISSTTLRRAKASAGVKARKTSGGGPWEWYLASAPTKVLTVDEPFRHMVDGHLGEYPANIRESAVSTDQGAHVQDDERLAADVGSRVSEGVAA